MVEAGLVALLGRRCGLAKKRNRKDGGRSRKCEKVLHCFVHIIARGRSRFRNGGLHGEDLDGFSQRGHRIARGDKLVRHKTLEVQVGDGLGHRVPLQFLAAVQFVTSRDAAGMEVPNVIGCCPGWCE